MVKRKRACMSVSKQGRIALALLAISAAGSWAQSTGSGPQKMVRFGDVVLRDFVRAELELGVVAKVSGPSTRVDVVDSERKSTAQIRAQQITAKLSRPSRENAPQRDVGRVDRIEAVGSVRVNAERKETETTTPVQIEATGSKAIYEREADRLTLEGPVTFRAEQPDPAKRGKEVVSGKAKSAVYDAGKRVLRLLGDVEATVVTPDTPPEGSSFSGDEVTIDMSTQPYKVSISNPSLTGAITIKVREPEKSDQSEGKKP